MANINRNAEDYDQNLEIKSYFQSVNRTFSSAKMIERISSSDVCQFKHLRRLTIANPSNIQQYEVILLKRAKSYALVGLKGEVR